MNMIALGACYDEFKGLPDGISLVDHDGTLMFTFTAEDVIQEEKELIQNGSIDFYFGIINELPMMVLCFDDKHYMDCVIATPERVKPITFEEGYGYCVNILLADTSNGEIKALRVIGLSTDMSKRINNCLVDKKPMPAFMLIPSVARIQDKYTSEELKDIMEDVSHFRIG